MAERWATVSDEQLEASLRALAPRIEFPGADARDVAAEVAPAIAASRREATVRAISAASRPRRWLTVVAAAVLAAVVALGSVVAISPAARDAVAGWLGLDGVRIERTAAPPTPASRPPSGRGATLDLGTRMTIGEAQALASYAIELPSDPALGAPDEVWESPTAPGGRVSLVYRARPGLPAATQTGVGVLLMEFRASIRRDLLVKKLAGPGSGVRFVRVNGDPGYWISGAPHEFFLLAPDGRPVPETTRLAGNVLIWEHDGVVLRIESALRLGAALRIATSVR